jgi:hypothetical protein
MAAIHSLKALITRIAGRITKARPDFYCAQCGRWERCGLPPSSDCTPMLMQIELQGGEVRQAPSIAAAWPHDLR